MKKDQFARLSYPSLIKSRTTLSFVFCCFFLGSCSQRLATVKPVSPTEAMKKTVVTTSNKDLPQADQVNPGSTANPDTNTHSEVDPGLSTGLNEDTIDTSSSETDAVNHPATFRFFAVDSRSQPITLDQKLPLTFCVQRKGSYRPFCKSLRSTNDGADYSSRGQEGSPRSHSPLQGVIIEVETDPQSTLGTEYYYSGYQPAGYSMKVFQKSDPTCGIQKFSDLQGIVFSPYADARDAHLGLDNPKVPLKTNECVSIVFQYLTSPEIKVQYSAQSQVEMLQPENFSEWLSVDGSNWQSCSYADLSLKDVSIGPKSLPFCGSHHVVREDGGNANYQLGMMISLSSPFGGVITDFDLWWRKPAETSAQGVMQIGEISTPTDSGVQFDTSWSKWSSDAVRQYDVHLNQCASTEPGKIVTTTSSVWNQLSGAVTKYDVLGWYNNQPSSLAPCGREGGGFNWGFDVQLDPIKQGGCSPGVYGKEYSFCTWTRGAKLVPLATDMIGTTIGSLDTTPAFFPFGSKPYLIAGTPELYMFTRKHRKSSVITAVHRMQRMNLIPSGSHYFAGGSDGQIGMGSWRAFKQSALIAAKAYLILVDTHGKKAAWSFDPNLKLDQNSKVPGTVIPVLGNLGLDVLKGGGLLSNLAADPGAKLIQAICSETYSSKSCKNGRTQLDQASIDRMLFLFPLETAPNQFRVLSLHRAEIQSGRVGSGAQVGYQPSPIFLSVSEKRILFGGPFFIGKPQLLAEGGAQASGLNRSIQYPVSTFVYDYGFNEDLNNLSLMEAPSGY